jgi:peptide/nickel transport system substrate-binding protein
MKFLTPLFAATLVALSSTSGLANKADDTFRWSSMYPVNTPDPYYNVSREMVIMTAPLVWDTLINRDPDSGDFVPLLAKSWKWVDPTTLDFELRDDVKWQDDRPLSPQDAVYTLTYAADLNHKLPYSSSYSWMKSAEVTGPHSFRLNLKAPFGPALTYLSLLLPIVQENFYDANGKPPPVSKIFGTGPYRMVEFTPGTSIGIDLTHKYFAGSPKGQPTIGHVMLLTIPDISTEIAALLSKDVDWIYNIPPDQRDQIASTGKVNVVTSTAIRFSNILFNTREQPGKKNPLTDLRVRRAVAYAIDREAIRKDLIGEGSTVQRAACYQTQFGCYQDVPQYEFNPGKAKQLLAEAGYANGVTVDLQATRSRDWTSVVAGYLQAVGINTVIDFLPYTNAQVKLANNQSQLYMNDDGSLSINDAYAFLNRMFGAEYDETQNPELQDLLAKGKETADPAKRKEYYARLLTLISDQMFMLPLWSHPQIYGLSKELDFKPWPDELARFYLTKWK